MFCSSQRSENHLLPPCNRNMSRLLLAQNASQSLNQIFCTSCQSGATQHAVNLTSNWARQLLLEIANDHFHGCLGHLFRKTGLLLNQLDQLVHSFHLLSMCEV